MSEPFAIQTAGDEIECIIMKTGIEETAGEEDDTQRLALSAQDTDKCHLTTDGTGLALIEQLPFDVLSHIFEVCGHEDWMVSLRISWVSRSFRKAVFDAPYAWNFLKVKLDPPFKMIRHHLPLITRRPVHIWLDNSQIPDEILSEIANHLHCLSIDTLDLSRVSPVFPKLTRISAGTTRPYKLSACCFPVLRDVRTRFFSEIVTTSIEDKYPLLEALEMKVNSKSIWLVPLQAYAETLVSLKVDVKYNYDFYNRDPIVFPRLRCLHIDLQNQQGWSLDLQTPRLETYIETRADPINLPLIHQDLDSITRIRLDHDTLSSPSTKLRLVQLITSKEVTLMNVIRFYCNVYLFPTLESVEVLFTSAPNGGMAQLLSRMRKAVHSDKVSLVDWLTPPPDSLGSVSGESW